MVMNSDNSLNIWDLNTERLLRYGLEQTQNVKKNYEEYRKGDPCSKYRT